MKRELIKTHANGDMFVIDSWSDMFGVPYFQAGIITMEMRPTAVFKKLGGSTDRTVALAALSTPQNATCEAEQK